MSVYRSNLYNNVRLNRSQNNLENVKACNLFFNVDNSTSQTAMFSSI